MTIDQLAKEIHATADKSGFWPDDLIKAKEALLELWKDFDGDDPRLSAIADYLADQSVRNMGEMLMLATSELAEALEEHRDGRPAAEWRCKECGRGTGRLDFDLDTIRHPESLMHYTGEEHHSPGNYCWGEFKPEGILVEIGDAVIRLLDTAQDESCQSTVTLGEAIRIKMDYNSKRPFKHGKAY